VKFNNQVSSLRKLNTPNTKKVVSRSVRRAYADGANGIMEYMWKTVREGRGQANQKVLMCFLPNVNFVKIV